MTIAPVPRRRTSSTVLAAEAAALACSVDRRATEAAVAMLASGGSAADAAIAANGVLAVTSPHLCGMGGDLWAVVHEPGGEPTVLDATGRAGSGVDADALRARGLTQMPRRGDPVSVTVPGCVDGWVALATRYGRLPLGEVLEPAIELAAEGFAASELLAAAAGLVDHLGVDGITAGLREGQHLRRPGVADALAAVARDGRDGFYGGRFGRGLLEVGRGVFAPGDLQRTHADWVVAAGLDLFGHRIWTTPPSSQGYLILAILTVAERLGLPRDERDPEWLRTLVHATVATGVDRPRLLHERADAEVLLGPDNLTRWADATRLGSDDAPPLSDPGDTTYLCVRDRAGLAVSLIQSNAMDFGIHLVEPATGIFLHNRGVGFTLEPGHPAELAPGARPPSTLSPVLVTDEHLALVAVAGTMGGDSQPHLMAQHLCRLLHQRTDPTELLARSRWVLTRTGDRGFDLWPEGSAPPEWLLVTDRDGLDRWRVPPPGISLRAAPEPWSSPRFGHAQLIARAEDGWIAAAEPRVREAAAALA